MRLPPPFIIGLLVASLAVCLPAGPANAGELSLTYSETARNFLLERHTDGGARMQFEAYGQHFSIELESNRRLLDAASQATRIATASVELWRGHMDGIAGSWARVTVANGTIHAMVWDGSELYALEDAATAAALPGATAGKATQGQIVYRARDLHGPIRDLVVPALEARRDQQGLNKWPGNRGNEKGAAQERLQIGVVSDVEFARAHPAGAESAILAIMNEVDGIFSADIGIQIAVTEIITHGSEPDPFSSDSADGLLNEISSLRVATPALRQLGLSHLFTGKTLDDNRVGIAFLGGLCARENGVGVTVATSSITADALIAAHEIGHNFGAPHDGEAGSACESSPLGFVMAPFIQQGGQFSPCSLEQMAPVVAAATCLEPLLDNDVSGTANVRTSSLLGTRFGATFDVHAAGSEDAFGLLALISLDPGLRFPVPQDAQDECSFEERDAQCTRSALTPEDTWSVNLELETVAVGPSGGTLAVSANNPDPVLDNNEVAFSVMVDTAVDLNVSLESAERIARPGDVIAIDATLVSELSPPANSTQLEVRMLSPQDDVLSVSSAAASCAALAPPPAPPDVSWVCQVGTLPQGQPVTITAEVGIGPTAIGPTPRTLQLVFIGSALEPDSKSQNDSATASIELHDALIDLTASILTLPADLLINTGASVRLAVANEGLDDATSVRVQIDFDDVGVQIDSAMLDGGSCAAEGSGRQVCSVDRLAAGATVPIDLQIQTLVSGTVAVSMSSSAAEFELTPQDDSAAGSFLSLLPPLQPSPPPANSGGGGGGGGGAAPSLLLAGLMLAWRRLARRTCNLQKPQLRLAS